MKSDVKDLKLNRMGRDRVEWAYQDMPVLQEINKDLSKRKPFKGINVAACLHVTTETANLLITLKNGGANVSACASGTCYFKQKNRCLDSSRYAG